MQKLPARAAFAVIASLFVVSPGYAQTLGTSAAVPSPDSSFGSTTGMFSPNSTAVAVSISDSEKMRVNATGVGIGTTTPKSELDVYGGVSIGTNYAGVTAAPTNGLIVQGNVGIGTASPSHTEDINGNIGVSTWIYTGSGISFLGTGVLNIGGEGETTNIAFNTTTGGNDKMYISNAGNVGIGTTTVASKFEVNGNALVGYVDTAAPTNGLLVKGDASIGTTNSINPLDVYGAVAIGTSYAGVDTAPTNGLIVQGDVGIGTTSSSALLQVYSNNASGGYGLEIIESDANAQYAPRLQFTDNRTSGHEWQIVDGGYASSLTFQDQTANVTPLIIENTGYVGIDNTGPDYLLHVGSASASGIVVEFQNSSGGCTHNPGASSETVSCSSDVRLKEDIQDADSALEWIDDMRIRDFTIRATGDQATGVIAQEMLPNHPDMVHLNADGYYAVEEPNPWKLVKTIQELHSMTLNQQTEIDELRRDFEAYKEDHP